MVNKLFIEQSPWALYISPVLLLKELPCSLSHGKRASHIFAWLKLLSSWKNSVICHNFWFSWSKQSNSCKFLCWAVKWTPLPWDLKLELQIILRRETQERHSQNPLRAGTHCRVWWRLTFMCGAKGQGATSKETFWFGCKISFWRMAVGGVNCCIMFLCLTCLIMWLLRSFLHVERPAFMGENVAGIKADKWKTSPLKWSVLSRT